ncbi:hypothetical protein JTB14_003982 [Gonioctena quinquepunctata]|nr:hypothetical protein JTB14_003982 [Gonioctena quinquepunctata]
MTIIRMPESVYLAHICPESGTSPKIMKCILKYLDESHITTDELKVIGCDGTNETPDCIFGSLLCVEFSKLEALTYSTLRQFEVPNSLNINTSSYMDLIDWSTLVITEPPPTMGLPVEVLIDIVRNPDTPMVFSEIKSYPCHTIVVERAVKIVTGASATVSGSENRDGVIRAKLESREIIPSSGSKQDYKLN